MLSQLAKKSDPLSGSGHYPPAEVYGPSPPGMNPIQPTQNQKESSSMLCQIEQEMQFQGDLEEKGNQPTLSCKRPSTTSCTSAWLKEK